MSTDLIAEELKDHLVSRGPSQDPAYLAWKETKIREALRFARENPDKMIPAAKVWEKYGLAY